MPLVQPQLRRLEGNSDLLEWAEDVVNAYRALADVLSAGLHLGDPTHPQGTTQHPNGQLANFDISFVQVSFEATGTAVAFQHNLGASTTGVSNDTPNVCWLVIGAKHDGTASAGTHPWSLEYQEGDTIGADSIELRLRKAGGTVDATHPFKVVVCFWKGVTPW